METIAFIIIILALIILSAIIIYFVKDYIQYKTLVNTQFSVTESKVNAEKKDRLANLKYIVDQVNTVNDDISSTLDQQTDKQTNLASQLNASQANYLSGINSAFNFTDSNGKNISLPNLPGSVQPNMNLLTSVTATMGLTAKDLQPLGNSVKLCSKSDPNKCVQFPDQNGNVYLTDFGHGSVIIDSEKGATINNGINLTGGLNINAAAGSPSGTINPGPNQLLFQSSKVGVGNFASGAPNATLHVTSQNAGDNILQLSGSSGQQLITVAPDGIINIYKDSAKVGSIEPTSTGLKLNANTVTLSGNLTVAGNITGRVIPIPAAQ